MLAIWVLAGSIAVAGEGGAKVAMRLGDGRFLQAKKDGAIGPGRFLPGDEELFELQPRDGGSISLKAPGGRFFTSEDRDARRVRADSPRAEPGDRETFQVIAVDGNRVGLKARGYRSFVSFSPGDVRGAPASSVPSEKPRPEETLEIFYAGEVPATIRMALCAVVRSLVTEDLAGKAYDKVRSRKVERFVDLPAPTLRDPRRTRSHRVLSMIEEYHLRAELDGKPEIEITRLPTLKGYRDAGLSLMMFQAKATVPAKGRVGYKIPGAVGVSTGFSAEVRLDLIGELRLEKSGDKLSLGSPELREVHVGLQRLRVSNDLLDMARDPLEDLVNHELRRNEERIRQQANKSLAKAVQSREFHHPLLRLLSLP